MDYTTIKKRTGQRSYVEYINHVNVFDIETTSGYVGPAKVAHANVFIFNLLGERKIVRTMEEALAEFLRFSAHNDLEHETKRAVVYVHNLAYEFQFLKKELDIVPESIFSIESTRKIVKFNTYSGIEFRCSLVLTNMALAKWGESLGMHKPVEDWDYLLQRNPLTPLSDLEEGYAYTDVDIPYVGVNDLMTKYNDNICTIPMTSTGYVRRDVRNSVFADKKYKKLISRLEVTPQEYYALAEAYQGGLTRSNARYTGIELTNVVGYDIASSYPSVLALEKFPMSKAMEMYPQDVEELEFLCRDMCVLMTITITDVVLLRDYALISEHKCDIKGAKIIDNGRVTMAEEITITCTEVDYELYKDYYKFNIKSIGLAYIYEKAYLPRVLVQTILSYYANKTTLKDVPESIDIYNRSKAFINSIYGMMVSSYLHSIYEWNGNELIELPKELEDIEAEIEQVNEDKKRFIFYPWGVWCTSYARRNLMELNQKLEDADIADYYCDTDSRYVENNPQALDIISAINQNIKQKIEHVSQLQDIDISLFAPVAQNGEHYPIGVWEYDGEYDTFKTLGAKRYAGYKKGKLQITIAGLSKGAHDFIHANGGLSYFADGMYIPESHSGRNISTYIDKPLTYVHTDYLGNTYEVNNKSSLHLESSDYTLTLSDTYKDYLETLEEVKNYKNFFFI